MTRSSPLTACRRTALHEDDRLPPRDLHEAVEERPPVVHALDIREAHGGRVVVREPVEVVGDRDRGRVSRRNRTAHSDLALHRPVLERRDEVPGLTRDRDPTGRRIRRDDLCAQLHGRRHHTLAVRSGQQDSELVGERDQVALRAQAGVAGLAVTRAREECGADSPSRAGAQQVGVRAGGRADEHEVPRAVRKLVDSAGRFDAEHRNSFEVRRRDPARIPGREDVVERDEAELARMGRRAGDDHAARLEEGAERRVARARAHLRGYRRRGGIELDQRVDRDGAAVDHDERVEIDRHDVGPVAGEAGETDERRRDRRAVDSRLAAERPEQLLRREIVEKIFGVQLRKRHEPESGVTQRLGQHSPDPQHHTRTELAIADESRDQLARAAHHGRDQQLDRAVLRTRRREELARCSVDCGRVAQPEPDEAPLRLVRDGVATQLDDHRVTQPVRGRDGSDGVGGCSLVEHRYAVMREELLRRGFGEGRHRGRG